MSLNSQEPHLTRKLGAVSAIAVVVGSTIGSGIFRSPSGIADKLPTPGPMLAAWVFGGIFALCGALTLMEVGGAFPYAGGLYVFIREAYGRLAAFLFGWAQLVLIRPVSIAAVAIVFGEYAMRLTGGDPDSPAFAQSATMLAIGAIVIVGAINYRGVTWGSAVQVATTIAKCTGLLVLIVLAFTIGLPRTGGHFLPAFTEGSFTVSAFGLALVSVLWAFDGWSDVTYVGGEVKDPRKNLPKAILWGTLIITAFYLLANLAYLSVFSIGEIKGSKQVAADVMQTLIGPFGVVFIVATVMISTFGTLNGSMLTSPRVFFALAEDKLFFSAVAKVHPKFETPYVSTIMTCGLGVIYVSIAQFGDLADAFVTAMVPFYCLAVGSIFVFRSREMTSGRIEQMSSTESLHSDAPETVEESAVPNRPPYDPPVRTPLYPIVPALFVLSTIMLLVNALVDAGSRKLTLAVLGGILVGIPIYFCTVGKSPRVNL
jgi:amino acid transporter